MESVGSGECWLSTLSVGGEGWRLRVLVVHTVARSYFLFLMVYLNDSTRILFIYVQQIVVLDVPEAWRELLRTVGRWDWIRSTPRSLGPYSPWTRFLGSLTGAGE